MDIAELLAFAVKNNASDLHLSSGLPPMIRVDGDIRRLTLPALDTAQLQELLYSTMSDQQRRDYEANLEVDYSYSVQGLARFRVNCFHHDRGVGGAFRTIPDTVWTLEDIGAPPIFRDIIDAPRGLILMTGPTGSGKSTFVKLLQRLYDVDRGRITIDGQDIAAVTQESLRGRIGMVTQDTSLLHRSVFENIRYGRAEASMEQVIAAAERLAADGKLDLDELGPCIAMLQRARELSPDHLKVNMMLAASYRRAGDLPLKELIVPAVTLGRKGYRVGKGVRFVIDAAPRLL